MAGTALAIFMVAVSLGSLFGGSLSDRFGRLPVIGVSLFFISVGHWLMMHLSGLPQIAAAAFVGAMIGASFPVTIVLAQEDWPNNIGFASAMVMGLGWLPAGLGAWVVGRIAEVRGLPEGTPAVSPARFTDWTTLLDARALVDHVRERSGGIPVGVKMSAQHVEEDLDAALDLGADYVILDGRGGGTGAAPTIFRDTISVPTMAALARARRHLDLAGARQVTLIATGGLRRPQDIVKALALGADAVAVSNVALQAIGCVGMRACHTDNCPVGIATQKPHLRSRLPVQRAAEQLTRYLGAITELMVVLARACGHDSLSHFTPRDLTSWKRDVADLVGVRYAGVSR